jgi:hypothetical protein
MLIRFKRNVLLNKAFAYTFRFVGIEVAVMCVNVQLYGYELVV